MTDKLSAEQPYSRDELENFAENMRHPIVRQIVGAAEQKSINRLLATIDAQAAEIAALKGALEKVEAFCDPGELPVQPPETIAALGTEFLRGFEMGTAVAKSYLWFEVLGRRGKTLDEIKAARVLAGKGQCPKCEGRGFIRTMVDGQRDSEPCSYCRMSGLAGKEAQR